MNPKNLSCLLLVAMALVLSGCAAKTRATATVPTRPIDSLDYLRPDLERIFSDPVFSNAQWGIEIISLDRGDLLFERNSARLYMPASNNKILTAAAAVVRLGPDFRYQTQVSAEGDVENGVLKGNLIIAGAGDPTTAARFNEDDPFRVFRGWATRLKEKGIARIEGAIVGDGSAFPPPSIGMGWEWDDLASGYAAPVSALQFNENTFTVEILPGEAEGAPATVRCLPVPDYCPVEGMVATVAPGAEARLRIEPGDRSDAFVVRGSIAMRPEPQQRTLAVPTPGLFYVAALRHALQQEGIDLAQAELRSVEERNPGALPTAQLLWTHSSPPLSEILKPLLKVSQNLYAETLTRTLGLVVRREGSFNAGREVVQDILASMAVERDGYSYADGSGLSRHNLVSADMLIRILKYMHRHPYFAPFYDALPIAGVDGTIRSRMKGTKAENNVHAKTGTIAFVRCLSGYVRTEEGEMLAFAMIANNFLASNRAVEYVQDSALERLANFRRRD